MADINIEGILDAQKANLIAIAAMSPGGAFGEAIKDATIQTHAYEVKTMHAITGAMKASARMDINLESYRGLVFIDPDAYGERSGKPIDYAHYEHARGGEHAFAQKTVTEAGPVIGRKAIQTITRAALYGK